MIRSSMLENSISACRCYTFLEKRHSNSGKFKSPNYLNYFSSNIPCLLYIFRGSPGQIVKINFQSFQMRPQLNGSCVDYLELYLNLESIDSLSEKRYQYRICTSLPNQNEFFSKHNILIMKFHSYPSPQTDFYKGFIGTFQFLSKQSFQSNGQKIIGSKCSREFFSPAAIDWSEGKSGRFFSPNFPQNYESNTRCQFIFKAQPEERIILTFRSIYLDSQNTQCGSESQSDFILVTEQISETKKSVLAHLCGVFKYVQIVSHGPLVIVYFISNKNGIERKGFEALYEFVANYKVYPTSFINSSLELDAITKMELETLSKTEVHEFFSNKNISGVVTSPNYPNSYSNDCEVFYFFSGYSDQYIEIKFRELRLRSDENCQMNGGDRIEIYEGETSKSVVNREAPNIVFCGTMNYFYKSQSNNITMRFISKSKDIQNYSRFSFIYNFIFLVHTTTVPPREFITAETKTQCNFLIQSNGVSRKGKLTYFIENILAKENGKTCNWTLEGTRNQRIILKLWNSGIQSDSNNGNNFIPSCRLAKELQVFSYRSDSQAGGEHTDITRWCIADGVYSLMSSNVPRMVVIMHLGSLKASSDRYNEAFHVEYSFVEDFGVISNGLQKNSTCHFHFDSSRFKTGNFSSPNYPGYIPSNIACVYVFKGSARSQIQIFLTEPESIKYHSLKCSENNGNVLRFDSCSNQPLEITQIICRQNQVTRISPIIWSDNCLRISLISVGPEMYKGFYGHYKFIEIDQPNSTVARSVFATANSLIILMTITFLMVIY